MPTKESSHAEDDAARFQSGMESRFGRDRVPCRAGESVGSLPEHDIAGGPNGTGDDHSKRIRRKNEKHLVMLQKKKKQA